MNSNATSRQVVWEIMAQFWVDTWYDSEQLDAFARRLAASGLTLEELDRCVRVEVCGGFALYTLAVFLTAGMALPDWYYPEEDARKQVSGWLERPRVYSYGNPFWWLGYACARWFIRENWRDLRARVAATLTS